MYPVLVLNLKDLSWKKNFVVNNHYYFILVMYIHRHVNIISVTNAIIRLIDSVDTNRNISRIIAVNFERYLLNTSLYSNQKVYDIFSFILPIRIRYI